MKAVILLSKTFFPKHPKAGQETEFMGKVMVSVHQSSIYGNYYKIHTCRANYEYWKRKIYRLKAVNGVLSVRQWSGKPYGSPHETIVDIPAENVDVQKLSLWINKRTDFYAEGEIAPIHSIIEWEARVNGNNIPVSVLASNDGLTVEDYMAWFLPVFEKEKADILDFAIIHFTKFEY
jgi:hypothetical protein